MLTAVLIALNGVLIVLVALVWRSGVRREGRLAESAAQLTKASEQRVVASEQRFGELAQRLSRELEDGRSGEEESLSDLLERVGTLENAISDLASTLSELPPPPPAGLDEASIRPLIEEARGALEERLDRVEEELARPPEIPEVSAAPPEPDPPGVVEELSRRGYRDIRVLGAPREEGTEMRVAVEARREGMTFKGHVVLNEGRVEECRLSASWPMFP